MVRTADLALNANDGSKMLAVGNFMANDAGVHGEVKELTWYPGGVVVAKVCRAVRGGPSVVKYVLIQGDLSCEAL